MFKHKKFFFFLLLILFSIFILFIFIFIFYKIDKGYDALVKFENNKIILTINSKINNLINNNTSFELKYNDINFNIFLQKQQIIDTKFNLYIFSTEIELSNIYISKKNCVILLKNIPFYKHFINFI